MSDVIRIRQDKSQPYCWLYTAPCVKNSFTYNIQCFLPQSWTAPTSQGTSKLQKNRLRGTTRPSQGSKELQLSLCSGGKGWSYCIRNSAAAWATKILTCCINLCASWICYILLLSAICFSDLTLAVSVLLLKCTLRSRKYFLFWFLPCGLQKLWEIRQQRATVTTSSCSCWAAEKQMQTATVAERRHRWRNHLLPSPSAKREPVWEPGLCGAGSETCVREILMKTSALPLGSLPCTLLPNRPTLLHAAARPAGEHLPGHVCPGTAGHGVASDQTVSLWSGSM